MICQSNVTDTICPNDNNRYKNKMWSIVLVAFLLLFGSTIAQAIPRTWTNAGGNNLWNNSANWSPAGVPTSSDTVKFSSASNANCTLNVSPTIQALIVSNTYGGVLSVGSNTLTLTQALDIAGSSSLSAGTSTITVAPPTNGFFSLYSTQQLYNVTLNGGSSSQIRYSSPLTSPITIQNELNIVSVSSLYYGSGFTNAQMRVLGNLQCSDTDGWSASPSNSNPGTIYMSGTASQSVSGSGEITRLFIEKTSGSVSLSSFTGGLGLSGAWRQAWLTSSNQGTLDLGGTTCSMELVVWKGTLAGTGTINGFVSIKQNGVLSPAGTSTGCITINGGSGSFSGLSLEGTYTVDVLGSSACSQHDKVVVNNGNVGISNQTAIISGGSSSVQTSPITVIEYNSGNDISGHFNGLLNNGIATIGGNRFYVNYNGGNGNDVTLTYTTNQPPIAVCNPQTRYMGSTCTPQTIAGSVLGNGSYDPDGSSVSYSVTPAGPYSIGTTAVQVVVTDAQGGVSYCNTNVVVQDTTRPVFTGLNAVSIQCNGTHVFNAPSASDNCGNAYVVSANNWQTSDTLTFTSAGTYSILWYVYDDNGNYDSAYQVINVGDNIAPVPTVASLSQITGQCGVTITNYPTATDNCAGTITATTNDPLTYSAPGTYTITWNYSDGSGNNSSQTQSVLVAVSSAPIPDVAVLPTVRGECGVTVSAVPTATGNCSTTINGTTTSPLTYTSQGTYTITWNYVDGNNNVTTQNQTVVIDDTTKPVPNSAGLTTITGACSATVTGVPTATDNCAGTITATTTSPLTYSTPGTYSVIWQYNDGNGNTEFQPQTVIITDNIAPVPNSASLPTLTGQCGVTVTSIPTATDNCAGIITATTTNPLTYTQGGTYTITWTYTDANGNSSTQTQTVVVQDGTAPVPNATTLPTITAQCSATVSTIPTATDNCAGTVQGTTTNPLTYTSAGTHTIVWSFNDGRGNISTQNQTVIITDNIAPVPNVASLPTITRSCRFLLNSISYPWSTDNCSGLIRATTNAPNSFGVGSHTITWSYTDASGNTATQTQSVVVTDNIAPTSSSASLPVVRRQCNYTVGFPYPTATDNCRAGTFAGSPSQTTFTTQGTHTLVWTYNDNNGNTTTQTQTIIIQDTIKPTIICRGTASANAQSVGLNASGTLTLSGSNAGSLLHAATDNCGGSPTLSISSGQTSFNCTNLGQIYPIVVRATDAVGNFAECTTYIRIVPGAGNDNDCDGIHNVCDECDGGNDAVDNNNDGLPDCKYPPAFANVRSNWKVGTSKVWVWYRNSNTYNPTLIEYALLQNLINTNQVWLGGASYCSSSKAIAMDETEVSSDEHGITLSPNPVNNLLTLRINNNERVDKTVKIVDMLGNTIATFSMGANENERTVDITTLQIANGIYTMIVETANSRIGMQFIVVR
jgi:hypothetical protein